MYCLGLCQAQRVVQFWLSLHSHIYLFILFFIFGIRINRWLFQPPPFSFLFFLSFFASLGQSMGPFAGYWPMDQH